MRHVIWFLKAVWDQKRHDIGSSYYKEKCGHLEGRVEELTRETQSQIRQISALHDIIALWEKRFTVAAENVELARSMVAKWTRIHDSYNEGDA